MASAPLKRMTVDEFLVWAEAQAEQRFELVRGRPLAMSPERARYAEAKAEIYVALRGPSDRPLFHVTYCLTA